MNLPEVLADLGVRILSTGGTAKSIRENGIDVTDVSDYTGFPGDNEWEGKDATSKDSWWPACRQG